MASDLTEQDVPDKAGEIPAFVSREDLQLIRRGAKGRWPIPDVVRRRCIAQAIAIVRSDFASNRSKTAAMKLLADLDKLNMEQEKRDATGFAEVHKHEFSGRVDVDVRTLSDAELDAIIGDAPGPVAPGAGRA